MILSYLIHLGAWSEIIPLGLVTIHCGIFLHDSHCGMGHKPCTQGSKVVNMNHILLGFFLSKIGFTNQLITGTILQLDEFHSAKD